jgi:hypothetical protein
VRAIYCPTEFTFSRVEMPKLKIKSFRLKTLEYLRWRSSWFRISLVAWQSKTGGYPSSYSNHGPSVTVKDLAGDDSHLPVVPAGNLRMPCPMALAELRRVTPASTVRWLGLLLERELRGQDPWPHAQATREQFENHPTHDCETDPTISGH